MSAWGLMWNIHHVGKTLVGLQKEVVTAKRTVLQTRGVKSVIIRLESEVINDSLDNGEIFKRPDTTTYDHLNT
jgi:hypothetical protein